MIVGGRPLARLVAGCPAHGWVPGLGPVQASGASTTSSTVRVTGAPSRMYPVGGNTEGGVPVHLQTLCMRAWGLCGGLWD